MSANKSDIKEEEEKDGDEKNEHDDDVKTIARIAFTRPMIFLCFS